MDEITNEQLQIIVDYCLKNWESQWCEFKENFHWWEELWKNISAISNSLSMLNKNDWYIIYWVEPETHVPVWTNFVPSKEKWKWNEDLKPWLIRMLWWFWNFDFYITEFENLRLVVIKISAAQWKPINFDKISYIRDDSYTKPITACPHIEPKLWQSILMSSFDIEIAKTRIIKEKIFELIDWEWYCKIMKYEPITKETAFEKLIQDELIYEKEWLFDITNACALLFAADLDFFWLKYKSPRVITYRWKNKLHAINDIKWSKGYAIAFQWLLNYVLSQIPKIEIIEWERKTEIIYPKVTLREFIANALIHQDLRMKWTEVLIEIYDDRVEISNPWVPLIDIDRFIDHPPKSRNELIANFMRRASLCESRWSGIDRALEALSNEKLPNPKIEKDSDFTRVTLYRTNPLSRLTNNEKAQAIYWHCVLIYVLEGEPMTNDSICDRFWIEKQNSAVASRLIKLSKESWKIKPFDPNSKTRKHAKYIPFWVN